LKTNNISFNISDLTYWEEQYNRPKQGWDMGYVSPPLKAYIDQLKNKKIKVLVPGAGKGWEVKYLYDQGFENVFYLDFSVEAVKKFKENCPTFPENQILLDDFFLITRKFDLILEQTFLSSFQPKHWPEIAKKINSLLNPEGKYTGLLFNHDFGLKYPPFADVPEKYVSVFQPYFLFKKFEVAYNSIKPRAGRELFFIFQKK
jgi:thiopurine S-methyltransferase